ncbi:hypothetical protein [Tenacibaculum singaporense]|uniref:hypothetical protein n=1 Tax=Tenacibaculum singaporense TaxID=2358479 RepID=UPI000F682BF5|nr:hypothetical protein [Tenacibaculum singaporense]RSC93493.1 hypothetical protein EI424_09800 [Tenacibaculum singaporense]
MLSKKTYSKEYIDKCRAKVEKDISTFKSLADIITTGNQELNNALLTFEHRYFNNMVLVLETLFTHRMRGKEGKDGNPLNEVRMLSNSIMENDCKMSVDKTIKYKPEQSVLNYQIDDEIKLNQSDFTKLSEAFFDDLKAKYME